MSEPQEHSIEGLMKSLQGDPKQGGWKNLENIMDGKPSQEQMMELAQKRYNEAKIYHELFGASGPGRKVLEDLMNRTIRLATWPVDKPAGEANNHGFFREGQNSMVMHILAQVVIFEQGPPTAVDSGVNQKKS